MHIAYLKSTLAFFRSFSPMASFSFSCSYSASNCLMPLSLSLEIRVLRAARPL